GRRPGSTPRWPQGPRRGFPLRRQGTIHVKGVSWLLMSNSISLGRLHVRVALLHWLAMAAVLVAVLCCAAVLWGRGASRLFGLPMLRDPDLRRLLLVIFGLPLLVPDDRVRLISGLILAALMVAALAVLTWRVSLRLVAVGGLVAAGVVWGVWTNW